jgi:FkbM family methyltransferase
MSPSWQQEMKRHKYRRQILRDRFITDRALEPECEMLNSFLSPGDWAIDVGANIGHFTKRMSDIVAERGRVIAFEPVIDTFTLLAANTQHFKHQNVTLLNVAASDRCGVAGISIPRFDNGLNNYYEATLNESADGLQVMTLPIDLLDLAGPIRLVKIDAEWHELSVLKGMSQLLGRDKPIVIIEISSQEPHAFLFNLGYSRETIPGSQNHIFRA